ncbi:hypothetical protein GCM10023166_09440 [Paeniglutamicibacter cryotolerans]
MDFAGLLMLRLAADGIGNRLVARIKPIPMDMVTSVAGLATEAAWAQVDTLTTDEATSAMAALVANVLTTLFSPARCQISAA